MLIKSPHKPWRKGGGDQDEEHSQKYLTNLSKKNGKTYPGQKNNSFRYMNENKSSRHQGNSNKQGKPHAKCI